MGTNNLYTVTGGTTVQESDPNQYHTALSGDHIPRNSSGNITDNFSSLGSSTYWWKNIFVKTIAYLKKVVIGSEASGVEITESSGDMVLSVLTAKNFKSYINSVLMKNISATDHTFYIGGVAKSQIDANGLDGSYLKADSVGTAAYAPLSVDTAAIANLNVTEGKIAALAVTEGKIGASSVTNGKIAFNSVSMDQILNKTVTTSTFATDADSYYSSSSTVATNNSYVSGVSIAVTVNSPCVLAWHVQSSNTSQGVNIDLGSDIATVYNDYYKSGLIIATGNTTLTARAWSAVSQSGTVTLKVFPIY